MDPRPAMRCVVSDSDTTPLPRGFARALGCCENSLATTLPGRGGSVLDRRPDLVVGHFLGDEPPL